MTQSAQVIKLALDKFEQHIDNQIQKYNHKLNNILKNLTFLTVTALPQTVIGSLFGMNTPVLMQDNQTLFPFFGIMILTLFLSVLSIAYFRHKKYIDV